MGMKVVAVDILTRKQLETDLGLPCDEIAQEYDLSVYPAEAEEAIRRVDVIGVHLSATTVT